MIELHVLLLEDLIILLNKVDDKYVLKYYGFQDRTPTLSPIIKMSTALVRHNAVGECQKLFICLRNIYIYIQYCKLYVFRQKSYVLSKHITSWCSDI